MENKKIKKISEETCFDSLAYCCGLEKNCKSRDNVIKKLGLTKKDFLMLKSKFDEDLKEFIKNRKNE